MSASRQPVRFPLCAAFLAASALASAQPEPRLLFHLSADHGTTAEVATPGSAEPTFVDDVSTVPDGASGPALRCHEFQRLAWSAPGNVYAQRGTISFFWRARTPLGPTPFPLFRVAFADHSSWDMVFLRIDYNGHGLDAFVTDTGLARVRVSSTLATLPAPDRWIHVAFAWDEAIGVRLYLDGRLLAAKDQPALLDAALDQFGPHSRLVSPHNVQSDYNFIRGGDIDEIRIHDRSLDGEEIAALADRRSVAQASLPAIPGSAAAPNPASSAPPNTAGTEAGATPLPARIPVAQASLPAFPGSASTHAPDRFAAWRRRHDWADPAALPPPLPARATAVRKVEIHDAYDLKRWWWKANDGIRETTWPGVYNRSRLPGRHDYFELPDWDCYVESGRAITFTLPADEPVNHLEIVGPAWGHLGYSVTFSDDGPGFIPAKAPSTAAFTPALERPAGGTKTSHRLPEPVVGGALRFTNAEPETPIQEFGAYHVAPGHAPAGRTTLDYRLGFGPVDQPSLRSLGEYIAGRHPRDETGRLIARPAGESLAAASDHCRVTALPFVHILIPAPAGSQAVAQAAVPAVSDSASTAARRSTSPTGPSRLRSTLRTTPDEPVTDRSYFDATPGPAPSAAPNTAGTEAGATPLPARKPVAQASLPAFPDSASTAARRSTSPTGPSRLRSTLRTTPDEPVTDRSYFDATPGPAPSAAPNTAGTEAGATPRPAPKPVAQASVPAVSDSASTAARRSTSPTGPSRLRSTLRTTPDEPVTDRSYFDATPGPAPSAAPNTAGTEAGATPLPARKPVAQASLPAFPDSAAVSDEPVTDRSYSASTPAPPPPEQALDGIELELPALAGTEAIAFELRVKDPLWPGRDALDFSFTVAPGDAHTLWLDLRDRILPADRALYLTLAASSPAFDATVLVGARLRLVFKPAAEGRLEHLADRFTQVRDAYAMWVEERPRSPQYLLYRRLVGDLDDLLRIEPKHAIGLAYARQLWLDHPAPPFAPPEPPDGVPRWAFLQTELLKRLQYFAEWYVDHRQVDYGDLGGGISDDTDLTNYWPGLALMGCAPDKLTGSVTRLLDAAYRNGMFDRGLCAIQTDELHSYEEGVNCLGQNLILNYGSPRQLERAMETTRALYRLTGINPAGHRHLRSAYYSGSKLAEEGVWGWSRPYGHLVFQIPGLLADFNGSPEARRLIVETADGLLAHRRLGRDGSHHTPAAIHFATDAEAEAARNWLPWPLYWNAWQWTGERRYLDPVFDRGVNGLDALNANALDLLDLRAEWGPRILAGERGRPIQFRRIDRRPNANGGHRSDNRPDRHLVWQLTGDKARLESLYADQLEYCAVNEYINTEGSLWIDRPAVPVGDIQRARLGGIALLRNAPFPGHTVSWRFAAATQPVAQASLPAVPDSAATSIALLIPDATDTAFTVIAYNLATEPIRAEMTGWNVVPGNWSFTQGIDTDGDDRADASITSRTAPFERSRSIEIELPPRATTVLTCKLAEPGVPYWKRSDLGLDPQDVVVDGNTLRVTVHSLGAIASPPATVTLRDTFGNALATAEIPVIAAPTDLHPKTATVGLAIPQGATLADATVELAVAGETPEITQRNNCARINQ